MLQLRWNENELFVCWKRGGVGGLAWCFGNRECFTVMTSWGGGPTCAKEVGRFFCAEKLVITTNRCWLDFFGSRFWPNFGDLFLTPSFAQEPHFFDNDEEFALGASHYASWREKFSQPVKPAENLGFSSF